MAATIYSAPAEIGEFNDSEFFSGGFDRDGYFAAEKEYIDKIVAFAKEHGSGSLRGEIFREHVADGYASYVVLSSRPLALIHIDTGDGYHVSDIFRRGLTAKDVKESVERSKRLAALFAERKGATA